MSDALAVSPPVTPPSPQNVEKMPAERRESVNEGGDDSQQFAAALEAAVEPLLLEPASVDPLAASAVPQLPVLAAAEVDPALDGGSLGTGPAPLVHGRHPATVLPLRPESRAALQAAQPEANLDASNLAADAADAQRVAPEDTGRQARADTGAAPGKPFELVLERAASPASATTATAVEQPATPAPTATDGLTETARRDRPPVLKLDTQLPVHTPRFGEGFSQQVVVLAQHGIQQAQMSLSPPDLGPVDVRITIANDEASVQIAAPTGAARDAIQEALPRLKEMMEQSGVRLNDAGVFAQLPQRDQSAGTQHRADWWQQHQQHGDGIPADDPTPTPVLLTRIGLIDAYA